MTASVQTVMDEDGTKVVLADSLSRVADKCKMKATYPILLELGAIQFALRLCSLAFNRLVNCYIGG